jgi:hypothetical protein
MDAATRSQFEALLAGQFALETLLLCLLYHLKRRNVPDVAEVFAEATLALQTMSSGNQEPPSYLTEVIRLVERLGSNFQAERAPKLTH